MRSGIAEGRLRQRAARVVMIFKATHKVNFCAGREGDVLDLRLLAMTHAGSRTGSRSVVTLVLSFVLGLADPATA